MYKAILFAPDGDFVTDYRGQETIADVEELLANQGSRWYFYPFCFVIVDNQFQDLFNKRILSVPEFPEDWSWYKGKTVRKMRQFIKEYGVEIYNSLEGIFA